MVRGDPIVPAHARVADDGAGTVVPAGTPREIVLKLNDAAQKALADKEVIDTLVNKNALVIEGGPPERLAAAIRDDLAKWSRIVKMTGFKVD
ncbi:MAG: hypothetical protein AMXMBFR52_07490 [Burkholderiales bacterium]